LEGEIKKGASIEVQKVFFSVKIQPCPSIKATLFFQIFVLSEFCFAPSFPSTFNQTPVNQTSPFDRHILLGKGTRKRHEA
jgi:hypothetical protein